MTGMFGPAMAAGAATSWWSLGIGAAVAVAAAVAIEWAVGDVLEQEARWVLHAELSKFRMDALRRVRDAADGAIAAYVASREEAVAKAAERHLEALAH
jgi:hypothetical protein